MEGPFSYLVTGNGDRVPEGVAAVRWSLTLSGSVADPVAQYCNPRVDAW